MGEIAKVESDVWDGDIDRLLDQFGLTQRSEVLVVHPPESLARSGSNDLAVTRSLGSEPPASYRIVVCLGPTESDGREDLSALLAHAERVASHAVVIAGLPRSTLAIAGETLGRDAGHVYPFFEGHVPIALARLHLDLASREINQSALARLEEFVTQLSPGSIAPGAQSSPCLVYVKPLPPGPAAVAATLAHQLALTAQLLARTRLGLERREAQVSDLATKLAISVDRLAAEHSRGEDARRRLSRIRESPAWPFLAGAYRAGRAARALGRRVRRQSPSAAASRERDRA